MKAVEVASSAAKGREAGWTVVIAADLQKAEGDRDHRHFAERGRDHDHDFDHRGRHRVFRNGVWVWVYGPDYSYNDCGWLLVRALDTGSPYWWNRYHYCIGY